MRRNKKGQFIKGSGRKVAKRRNPAPPALMVVNPANPKRSTKKGGRRKTARRAYDGRFIKMNPATGRPTGSIADAFASTLPGAGGGLLSYGVGWGLDKTKMTHRGKALAELAIAGIGGVGLSMAGMPNLGAGFAGGGMRGTLGHVWAWRAEEVAPVGAADAVEVDDIKGWGDLIQAPGNMGLTPAELSVLVNAPIAGVGTLIEAPPNLDEGVAGFGDHDDDDDADLLSGRFGDDDDDADAELLSGLGDDDDDPFGDLVAADSDPFGDDDDDDDDADPFS